MITSEDLGKIIKETRTQKGISQKELGKALHRSHAAISDIERGKTEISVRDLLTIAEFLKINVGNLLGIPYQIKIQGYNYTIPTSLNSNGSKINTSNNQQVYLSSNQ